MPWPASPHVAVRVQQTPRETPRAPNPPPPCANKQENSSGCSVRTLEPGKINSRRLVGARAALPAVAKALPGGGGGGPGLTPGSESHPWLRISRQGIFSPLWDSGAQPFAGKRPRPAVPPCLAALLSGFTRKKTWRHLQEFMLERSLPCGDRERCPPALESPGWHSVSRGCHPPGVTCFPRKVQWDGWGARQLASPSGFGNKQPLVQLGQMIRV